MSHSIRRQGSRKIAKDFARDPPMHEHSNTPSFIIFFPFPSPLPRFLLFFHFYPLSSAFLSLPRTRPIPRNEILYERTTEHVATIEVACELFDVDLPIDFHLRRFNSTSGFTPPPAPHNLLFSPFQPVYPLFSLYPPIVRARPPNYCVIRPSWAHTDRQIHDGVISFAVNVPKTQVEILPFLPSFSSRFFQRVRFSTMLLRCTEHDNKIGCEKDFNPSNFSHGFVVSATALMHPRVGWSSPFFLAQRVNEERNKEHCTFPVTFYTFKSVE